MYKNDSLSPKLIVTQREKERERERERERELTTEGNIS